MKEEAFWHSRSSHQWLVGGGAMPGGGAFVFVFLYLYFLAVVFSFVAFLYILVVVVVVVFLAMLLRDGFLGDMLIYMCHDTPICHDRPHPRNRISDLVLPLFHLRP